MQIIENQYLFVEKYRPQTVADCILPVRIKNVFEKYIKEKEFTHLLLSGGPGIGKTTIAKALCHELELEYLIINASENRNIDMIRNDIRQYASAMSHNGKNKVIILDEADNLNAQSAQPALRGVMEEFASNVRFILTCNYKNKLIQPIHSRCACITFDVSKDERNSMIIEFAKRLFDILNFEKVEFNKRTVVDIVAIHFPDFRACLNKLQSSCQDGKLVVANDSTSLDYDVLLASMKDKKFNAIHEWVVQNLDNDTETIYHNIYEKLSAVLKDSSIPTAIIILADYQYKQAFVANKEINLRACLIELVIDCDFK